ncbi:MAG: polysaccharide lyase 6 family protein [Bryobacterales bacterium]|nr:polysaccharide lyase 6 family protein [Bryobacterales bacterium]
MARTKVLISRRALLLSPALLGAQQTSMVRNRDELNAALASAKPGTRLVLGNGTWSDVEIRIETEGTASAPLTIEAETPGEVILTGRSSLRIGGRHIVVRGLRFQAGALDGDVIAFRTTSTRVARYCRVTQCAIIDYQPLTEGRDTKWVSLYGYRNRVDHCYLAGKRNLGTTVVIWLPSSAEPNHHWIDHNHFGPRPPLGQNGGETIRTGDSNTSMQSSYTLVEHNYFHACDGEIEIVSNKSCDNVYRNNTFERCAGTLTLRHGNRCLVSGNVFLGHGKASTGGIRIIGEDHRVVNNYCHGLTGTTTRAAISMMNGLPESPLSGYFQVKRAVVAHNSVIGCAEAFAIGTGTSDAQHLAPVECVAANNLVSATRTAVRMLDAQAQVEWPGNLFHGPDASEWGTAIADPKLVLVEGLWEPSDESTLPASPLSLAEAREDLYGRMRRLPAYAGCFERSDEPRRWTVASASNTGPSWMA